MKKLGFSPSPTHLYGKQTVDMFLFDQMEVDIEILI
jgi:hypothetical protein